MEYNSMLFKIMTDYDSLEVLNSTTSHFNHILIMNYYISY